MLSLLVGVGLFSLLWSTCYATSPIPTVSKRRCIYIRQNIGNNQYRYKKICPTLKQKKMRLDKYLSSLSTTKTSAFQKRIDKEQQYYRNRYGIVFYKPTYVLPYYNTFDPYASIYRNNTPDNQKLMSNEFKAQLSLKFPLWRHMFHTNNILNVAYTQLVYWQFYAKSQYFRETNYEPAIFISNNFLKNWQYLIGAVHQSNGRGGSLERSWNRAFVDIQFSRGDWFVSVRPWLLIFKRYSSNLHNPDIASYLGYERIVIAYKFHHQVISLMLRNTIDSGFKRGAEELDYSFPITGLLHGYVQFFSGYGQSLIEYDHYTNSIGVGVSLSNWL